MGGREGGRDVQIEVTELRLRLERPLSPAEATRLRGYFGWAFADEVAAHHHRPEGGLLYDYPRVQYKVLDRAALVLGLGAEAGRLVERAHRESGDIRLGDEALGVLESTLSHQEAELGDIAEPAGYEFLTPWLALNADNARRYADARTPAERLDLLGRVLVGNCLSLAKAFGLRVTRRLAADVSGLRETECRPKGVPMRGLLGRASVNFRLPASIGLGKSVSRGFGTIIPTSPRVTGIAESAAFSAGPPDETHVTFPDKIARPGIDPTHAGPGLAAGDRIGSQVTHRDVPLGEAT